MVKVSIDVTGDKELVNKLKKFKIDLSDFPSEMDALGRYFIRFFGRDVFVTEGDIFGERWSRLSSKYEFWKRKKYAGRGILERTGILKSGYQMKSGKDYVSIFNDVPYAKYHHFGTSRLPKRTLIKIDDDRRKYIVDLFKQSVIGKIKTTFK